MNLLMTIGLFTTMDIGNAAKYLSNFKFEPTVAGPENLIKDYVTLAVDPKANLADSFTVCNSIYVEFASSASSVISMSKDDGATWFLLLIFHAIRDYKSLSETISLYYENPLTGKDEIEVLSNSDVPIVPHSWYHVCMGIDTVSGLLRVAANGIVVANVEKEYFKNTNIWKPTSVEGKILQYKGYMSGFWIQCRAKFSNMNIFNSMMSVEDMVARTTGGEECSSPGDYLR